jgi:hypothetical protein
MGDNLPYVDLGPGRTVKELEGGGVVYCAILDNDLLKCWGDNSPQHVYGMLIPSANTQGDGPNEMGANLPYVDLGTGRTVQQVQVSFGACLTLDKGDVKCWSMNESVFSDGPGTMGDNLPIIPLGGGAKQADPVPDGRACALMNDKRVKCWDDYNPPAYVVFPGALQTAKSINENCAILTDNTLSCF